jgi:hypothetical protein
MAKNKGRPENLVPLTTEKAREIGAAGGKKSVEVRREKKMLSQMYAELLAKGFEVEGERLTLDEVASAIIARRDSASVSMLKEIREATEGNRIIQESIPAITISPRNDAD